MHEQTIWLTARATAFTAVCEPCAAEQGYLAAHVEGRLELERRHGSTACARGHELRIERASPSPAGSVSHAA